MYYDFGNSYKEMDNFYIQKIEENTIGFKDKARTIKSLWRFSFRFFLVLKDSRPSSLLVNNFTQTQTPSEKKKKCKTAEEDIKTPYLHNYTDLVNQWQ